MSANPPPFQFPREYSYPPFFTRQLNLATLHAQQTKWAALVLAFCRHHRLFRLSAGAALADPDHAAAALFHNNVLGRRLAPAHARELLDGMRRDGRAELLGPSPAAPSPDDVFWIYWRTPDEWAGLIEAWIEDTGQKGTVLTLYELTQADSTVGTEFHGIDPDLLVKALNVLTKKGKAQIFGQEGSQGVKFF